MNEIAEKADKVIFNTYKRSDVVFVRGEGCKLWDSEGREYTDFVAGVAVCGLGHAHPGVAKALAAQAENLLHVSNLYYTVPQTELASWLVSNCFADKVFFCNSGAEANEAAIKLARRYFSEKGDKKRFRIVAAEQSFHGRTMAALSATGQDKIKQGFEPVLNGFDFVPFNDVEALEEKVDASTCAVMLEPIQGEGGIRVPSADYFKKVGQICDDAGCLLILDEIQTGIGRTGKLFAHEHFGIKPDIMTLAKALGNGLPIGAMLASDEAAKGFGYGSHASTFGGTPVMTAGALEVVRTIDRENIVELCAKTGKYFKDSLLRLAERHETIEEVRGIGLLLGIKLKIDGAAVAEECMKNGFVVNCIQEKILRFVPPLVVTAGEIDILVECLDEIFHKLEANHP